jgi:hypothetical protein
MALKVAHNDLGYLTLYADTGPFHFEIGDQPPQSPPPPKDPRKREEKPGEIVLGPLPSPPLPTGLVIGGDLGKNRRAGGYSINLAEAIRNAEFSPEAIKDIGDAAKSSSAGGTFQLDAYLPPHQMVDLDLLSRHVNKLAQQIGRPIGMRIGTRTD